MNKKIRVEQVESSTITPGRREGPCVLSFAQERLWFLDRYEPNTPLYNMAGAKQLQGELDRAALAAALERLVERHETLRTTFQASESGPLQFVSAQAKVELKEIEVARPDGPEREREIQQIMKREARRPFDLRRDLLFRPVLLKLAERDHILLLCIHHIAADGWSFAVLFLELAEIYRAQITGNPAKLPALQIRYTDYCLWQRERVSGAVLERELAYWRKRLANYPPMLALPTDHPRPAVQTSVGSSESISLGAGLTEKLRQFAKARKMTPYTVLLAALQTLFHRLSGQTDILVGSPIAGRMRWELSGLVGLFVNTLVHRADFSGEQSFAQVLRQTHLSCSEAYDHQELPFEKLVAMLQPERNLSHAPVVQVAFAFLSSSGAELELPGIKTSDMEVRTDTAKFDLLFYLVDNKRGVVNGNVEYDTDLFEAETIRRMIGHFHTLLAAALRNPDQPVSSLPLLTGPERQQILIEWNRTGAAYPPQCVHQLFQQQAENYPDDIALEFGNERLTYRQLSYKADHLASFLLDSGIRPGDRVGVFMERSSELVITLLAILNCGAVYVPLDTTLPRARLAFLISDAHIRLVATSTNLTGLLPSGTPSFVPRDVLHAGTSDNVVENPLIRSGSARPAYIMYTSGSTGHPKGVVIPHRGIVRLVRNTDYIQPGREDVFLHHAPVSFDASTFEIWAALLNGSRLVIAPPGSLSLGDFRELIQKRRISVLWLTTAMFNLGVTENPGMFGGVQQVITGGEVVPPEQVADFKSRYPACKLICAYGPTENTTFSCCYPVPETFNSAEPVPIGRPIANTRAYILDNRLTPVPVGVCGELYLGGAGLALEYVGRPDLTKVAFVEVVGLGRLYKTGDLASWQADGNIRFQGRCDYQVKIRGFRVEPEEIDAALNRLSGVKACVTLCDEKEGEKMLTSYLVLDELVDDNWRDRIVNQLKQTLPNYMVPRFLLRLESLPLNRSGKIDRKALRLRQNKQQSQHLRVVAPATPTEQALAKIWKSVLNCDHEISIHDDFFDLGGHSLLAVKLVLRIEQHFERAFSLAAFLRFHTIFETARRLDEEAAQLARTVVGPRQTGGAVSSSADRDDFHQQRIYISGWKGHRAHADSLIVQLNQEGTRPALFWSGQDFGEVKSIGQHLRDGRLLCGMRSSRFLEDLGDSQVDALAERYASEIQEIQTEGPYFLGGYCLGAHMSLAVARILQGRGAKIAHVIIVEGIQHVLENKKVYDFPVTLVFARDSGANPYKYFVSPEYAYRRFFRSSCNVSVVPCRHEAPFLEPYIRKLTATLAKALAAPGPPYSSRNQHSGEPLLMPATARRARITLSADTPATVRLNDLESGEEIPLSVNIVNMSAVPWPAAKTSGLFLNNRWLNEDDKNIQWSDDPVALDHSLAPRSGIELRTTLRAPMDPGPYLLLLDLVEEGVTWFHTKDSEPLRIACVVKGSATESLYTIDTDESLRRRADRQFSLGDYIGCISHYRRLILIDRERPAEVYRNLGTALFQRSDHAGAVDTLQRVVDSDPTDVDVLIMQAEAFLELDDAQSALNPLKQAYGFDEQNCAVVQLLGEAYARLDQEGAAIRYGRQAIALEAKSMRLHLALANTYRHFGRLDEAIVSSRAAIDAEHNTPNGYQMLADLLLQQSRPVDALEVVDTALLLDPDNYKTHKMLVRCHQANGDLELAIATCELAIKKHPAWRGIYRAIESEPTAGSLGEP